MFTGRDVSCLIKFLHNCYGRLWDWKKFNWLFWSIKLFEITRKLIISFEIYWSEVFEKIILKNFSLFKKEYKNFLKSVTTQTNQYFFHWLKGFAFNQNSVKLVKDLKAFCVRNKRNKNARNTFEAQQTPLNLLLGIGKEININVLLPISDVFTVEQNL